MERTLNSLRNLRHSNYEVLVVNGPSTDATEVILQKYDNMIRVGHCAEANLSKSRNVGIAMSAGELVCFLDDDAVPEPHWLCELEAAYADPSVSAVGGYIRDHTGYSFQSRALVCDRFGVSTDYATIEKADISLGATPDRYFSLTGTNCSFKRSILLELGGFDEEYAYFLDETDVIVRLVDAGHKVVYMPSAEIHHKYAESHLRSADRIPKSMYLPARSTAYFCIKNAVPKYSLDEVFSHLERYRSSLRKDYDWYLEHNRIDHDHHKRLHDDIDRGIKDGISDAHAYPARRLLKLDDMKLHAGDFKSVKTLLPKDERIKICLLSQDYLPKTCGGIGVWTHELATGLAALGHEVTVITRGNDHPTVDFENGVWVHRIVSQFQSTRDTPLLPDLPQVVKDYAYTAYDEVMRVAVLRGLDIVSSPIWDLEGAACIADGSIPTILSLHSTFKLVLPSKPEWHENESYRKGHVDKMIEGEAWALKNANHVLANSKAILNDIGHAYGIKIDENRVSVVPHGIDVSADIHTMPIKKINPKAVSLLFVGRFEKRKGIDLLLESLPALLVQHPNLEVNLVGDHTVAFDGITPLWLRFQGQHKNQPWYSRIKIHGEVSHTALQDFYATCDIFVAPSRYESFGLIFIEAMRYGKPCIGSDVGGIPEVISNGVSGLLVRPDDSKALASAIDKLVGGTEFRNRLGTEGKKRVYELFSTQKMVQSCCEMYKQFKQFAV
jgi:glycogen synthase